jgi:hypothetical protein
MKVFTSMVMKKMMTLFTVIIFFNMNFFLAEVEALQLLKNRKMMENIAKLVAGAANEEEKDIAGCCSEEGNSATSEIDLLLTHHIHPETFSVTALNKVHWISSNTKLLTRSKELVCPPPEA